MPVVSPASKSVPPPGSASVRTSELIDRHQGGKGACAAPGAPHRFPRTKPATASRSRSMLVTFARPRQLHGEAHPPVCRQNFLRVFPGLGVKMTIEPRTCERNLGAVRERRTAKLDGRWGWGRWQRGRPTLRFCAASCRSSTRAFRAVARARRRARHWRRRLGDVHSGPALDTSADEPQALPAEPSRARHATRNASPNVGTAIAHSAAHYSLSPALVAAVAWREFAFNAQAVSPKGAKGIMQLMPETARAYCVAPCSASQNVEAGTAYLQTLMQRYDGDIVKALAAYDAGPRAVDRFGGLPPYHETQAYVDAILARMSATALAGPN